MSHMGKITGFLEIDREDRTYEPAADRIRHWREFVIAPGEAEITRQAARCMDCGIPYCHTGCPVNNQIPDWNDLVYHSDWQVAAENLHSTNNFPEVTGRICPAPSSRASWLLRLEDYLPLPAPPLPRMPISISPSPAFSAICALAISSSARRYSTGITLTNFGR